MMKVLFVLQSIGYGGSMTSLINLMTLLKEDNRIEFEVLFMDPYGELFNDARKIASICERDKKLESVALSRSKISDLKMHDLLLRRLYYAVKGKLLRKSVSEVGYADAARRYDNQYDCVIAYQESMATDFVRYIKTKKRIAWVHNDYKNVLKIYGDNDRLKKVYSTYDRVVCVSKAGADNFKKYSGLSVDKITFVYNTLLVDVLENKASDSIERILPEEKTHEIMQALECDVIKFVSSGRFTKQKRFERVIKAAAIVRDKGYEFQWFILGNGVLYDEIEQKIKEQHLEHYIHLTGGLVNPFPIVKACDVFVLTSEFEAHPMVANEALILGKPVISTDFESAHEVILDNRNGLICGMKSSEIAETIIKLLDNKELYNRIKDNAVAFNYINDTIINQVMEIISQ